jgi:hypothetical protein
MVFPDCLGRNIGILPKAKTGIVSQFHHKSRPDQSQAFFILHPIRNLIYSDAHH